MPYIDISIREKIATKTDDVGYVCGNSDYMIRFDFDAEWEAHRYRTARFIFNGKFIEMVFEGGECPVPIIDNTYCFEVGVYAGDLHTTTPAYVPCKKSILCGGAIPDTVRPEAYYAADALEGKQDKLDAGDGIVIEDGVISADLGGCATKSYVDAAIANAIGNADALLGTGVIE